ncbi:MMPL family transporter [Sanguibacter hominis ATCC BAA-789]|uniref:MMPL family transporter n=1 Tax=Sanguibacter hominis ATCC BAA-789 TaxID=1312740 RepID=A0A9X5FBS0_9MICO|nr:MMPL family transporter [Sanguibacter hominis ATCC BAA-789]
MPKSSPALHAGRTSRGNRRWLRTFLPAVLVLVWLGLAAVGGPLFGRVEEVSSNDATAFLPTSADATQVQKALGEFQGTDAIPAIVVLASEQPLTEQQLGEIGTLVGTLASLPEVPTEPSPPIPSEDGKAVQVFVPLDAEGEIAENVETLRTALADGAPEGVTAQVTGPAGFTADLTEAFAGIDGILLLAALGTVLVILIVVYRSPILPFVVLFTSLFALCAALMTVWFLAREGIVLLSGQTQGILFILVIGAATDYGLLYVARFREELRNFSSTWDATRAAVKGSAEPILASGGTVITGLLCLLLSDLQSNRSLGPIASIGIVFALLAAFTLLPAMLQLIGRAAFWPRRPVLLPEGASADEDAHLPTRGVWRAIPRAVSRRPRTLWVATTLVLVLACAALPQLKASGVPSSDLVLGSSEARDGQKTLGEHFPGGSGTPAYVLTPEADLQQVADTLLATDGVASVAVTAADSPSGSAPVTAEGITAFGPPGTPAPAPTVSDGKVLLQATLTDASDSDAAAETVRALRDAVGPDVLVGGVTATSVDSNDASVHDRNLIIPVILVVILLILMLLLRSILAPVLLIATVVLSFGSALGISALVFNHVLGLPGADPAVPLFAFVFLVALGIDYNIFLMTRVREETIKHGTHAGITRGLAITGGVITSAGLVLAATFAALAVIPILFLLQLAFIVAFGVLLDTIVVRTILVPALAHDIGRTIWWPSKLAKAAR